VNNLRGLLVLVAAGLLLAACSAPSASPPAVDLAAESQRVPVDGGGTYTDVSVAGLSAMLAEKDFPLINVHVPYEGEIAGTDLFIPFDQIEQHLDQLPADKNARLLVYCRSGSMSAISARTLVGLGYTNVWNLDGGMIAWSQAGIELVGK